MAQDSTVSEVPWRTARISRPHLLGLLLTCGCSGEGLPPVHLDFSSHSACAGAPPQVVDGSASAIQCRVDYTFQINDDGVVPAQTEQATNELGSPVCCEVCALEDTADVACQGLCKYDLCGRARDAHVTAAKELSELPNCILDDCGFSFQSCLDTNLLHVQGMTIPGEFPQFYGLQASCNAHADDPVRVDGLFSYLEGLGAVPGAGGGLANVTDVVEFCLDRQDVQATGAAPEPTTSGGSSNSDSPEGADSTGTDTGVPGTTGDSPIPPPRPASCGPRATPRFWVRPSNNFGAWNEASEAYGSVEGATSAVVVTGGGIAYTMFPCESIADITCLRIDQLSVQLTEANAGLVIEVGLLEDPGLMPVTAEGRFAVPAGALRLIARSTWNGGEDLQVVTNNERAIGQLDATARSLRLEGLGATSEQGDLLASLSLAADLSNSQPRTKIIESRDERDGGLVLTAQTFDPDFDPIVHHWMVLGVGNWLGDSIAPALPVGRHAVLLYADDVHRARGVAARWVEVNPPVTP